jgi:hypothetical protein
MIRMRIKIRKRIRSKIRIKIRSTQIWADPDPTCPARNSGTPERCPMVNVAGRAVYNLPGQHP